MIGIFSNLFLAELPLWTDKKVEECPLWSHAAVHGNKTLKHGQSDWRRLRSTIDNPYGWQDSIGILRIDFKNDILSVRNKTDRCHTDAKIEGVDPFGECAVAFGLENQKPGSSFCVQIINQWWERC